MSEDVDGVGVGVGVGMGMGASGDGAGSEGGGPERRELGMLLLSAAADQAVIDAEEAVCVAWTRHLDRLLDATQCGVADARRRCERARERVRGEQRRGDVKALATAQSALEAAEKRWRADSADAVQVLGAVTRELEVVLQAERRRVEIVSENVKNIEDCRARCEAAAALEPRGAAHRSNPAPLPATATARPGDSGCDRARTLDESV